ncbi:MAG: hypothetical protein CMH32_00735 [Micavibrio sp.]|nr:hypothetical protein [Micavibrio sp.]HCK33241.1 hypothetical protein [Rhodospirillaceae bacterium]
MTQTTTQTPAYNELKQRFEEMNLLGAAHSVLLRDAQTVMAPGSGDQRSRVIGLISKIGHSKVTGDAVKTLLDQAEEERKYLSPDDQKNLSLMHAYWITESCMPEALVEEINSARMQGRQKHNTDSKKGDWANMKPFYQRAFDLQTQAAHYKQAALGMDTPYEPLLSYYSPTIDPTLIDHVFDELSKSLPGIIETATQYQEESPAIALYGDIDTEDKTEEQIKAEQTNILWRKFPMEKQIELCTHIVESMGYDLNKGRIDWVEGHPNTSGNGQDARISVWRQADFLQTLMAAMHEAGHAIYLQGLPEEFDNQPAGEFFGMSVHETQSMIFEKVAMKSMAFCEYLETLAREVFGLPDDPALDAHNLFKLMNKTTPSFIRVHADDMTYPAHIIVRYNIERDIINGKASVDDIPQMWNDAMQDLLGITPSNPAEGHMQDVHWPYGSIGYFPSYALGQIGAFQLFEAAQNQHPEIQDELREGNFDTLFNWLRKNIHSRGSLLSYDELFTQATGRPLEAKPFLTAMQNRVAQIRPATPEQNAAHITRKSTPL